MRTDGIVKIISAVVIVLIILGAVGFLIAFINNGQRNFYVMYGNEYIVGERKNFELPKDVYTVFHVGTFTGNKVEYDAAVTFDAESIENFEFTVGDEIYDFRAAFSDCDCSELFKLKKSENGIILFAAELTLKDVVQSKFEGEEVIGVPEAEFVKDAFVLTFTETVENSRTVIRFH